MAFVRVEGFYSIFTPVLLVSQDFQHALCCLFFGIKPVNQLSVFIIVNDNVFGRRNQAMFDSTISADLILVSAGMKKSEVQRFAVVQLWAEILR